MSIPQESRTTRGRACAQAPGRLDFTAGFVVVVVWLGAFDELEPEPPPQAAPSIAPNAMSRTSFVRTCCPPSGWRVYGA